MIGEIIKETDIVIGNDVEELAYHLHKEHCTKDCELSPLDDIQGKGKPWMEWAEKIIAEKEESDED
jgi:hypothetical protein